MTEVSSVAALVGNTPMVELKNIQSSLSLQARILVKVEFFNPAGSIKDRVAQAIIDDAEKNGRLQKGGTIIEATSGNTGIGLAFVAAARGYKAVIVMPDNMSVERRQLIAAYGAEVVLTDGKLGMRGSIEKAEELLKNTPNSIIAGQFVNPANALAHYQTTAPEIWKQSEGKVDIFVAAVGTGGTLTGIGSYLKEQNKKVCVVAVEPSTSPLLSQGRAGSHGIQGIGADFVPPVLNQEIYDEVLTVTEAESFAWAKRLSREEGLFVGISAGANVAAAVALAQRAENAGKTIVTVLPDGGSRYLSNGIV